MPERAWTHFEYRYGFNGKENERDFRDIGRQLDFGARIYDARLGQFLSLDPLQQKYPNESNYAFVSDNPILFADKDGKDKVVTVVTIGKDGKSTTVQRIDKNYFEYVPSMMTTMARSTAHPRKLSVYETYIIDLSNPNTQIQFSSSYKIEKTYKNLFSYYGDQFKLGGNESNKEAVGYLLFGSGRDMSEQMKNPKAAPSSEALNIELLVSALETWREIPSEKYGQGLLDFLSAEKVKSKFEKLENITKLASTIVTANGGDIPTGKKDFPPGYEKKPESIKDSILKPATGLMRDPNGLIYGFDKSSGPTIIYSNDSKTPDTIRTTIYENPKKR